MPPLETPGHAEAHILFAVVGIALAAFQMSTLAV
jgi:hypothetical protein